MEGKKKAVGGGRLKLKGAAISKQSKKGISSSRQLTGKQQESEAVEVPASSAGSGRIVSSGSTIQGFETKFREEVAVGDVIIIFHPTLLREEERIVIGILSQRSLTIHEKFSGDIASTTPYKIRKDSVLLEQQAALGISNDSSSSSSTQVTAVSPSSGPQRLQDEISRQLQKKLDKAKTTFSYREKTGMWGYRVVTEEVKTKNVTAEELLDRRVKKMGRDKFC